MGGRFRRPHGHNVGVAGCFQKGQAEGQDVETKNEEVKISGDTGGETEEGSYRVEREADHDGGLVRILADEEGCGERHREIPSVESRLDE